MFSSNSSNYFFKQSPRRFGSKQDDYYARVGNIVATTADNIFDAVREQRDLTQLFHDTVHSLGGMRHDIAVDHGTEHAEMYGNPRNGSSSAGFVMSTGLYEVYNEYNDRLLLELQRYLRTMKHTVKNFQQTELKVQREPCLGRRTSIEFSILSAEKGAEWQVAYSRETYDRMCGICSISPLDECSSIEQCFNHLMTTDVMRIIKEKSIDDYKRLKTMHVIKDVYNQFSGRKSDWVLATVRCEMHGKMYALTQYLTWMYRTYQDDPVDWMTTRTDPTVISLIHQDVFLINETLNDLANVFKQAIEWDGNNIQELMNLVGLINYLFAHAMPFERGSAAICEWLEMSIYRYHGLDLQYNEAVSINMEALVLPLNEFIEKYPSMVKLDPIVRNNVTLDVATGMG